MNIFLFMSTMHWNVKYLLICPAVSEVGRRNTKEKTFYFIQAVPRTLTKWISHYCLIKMVGWNQKNSVVLCSCPSPLQASFPPSCHPSLSTPWFWIHPVGSQNDHSWRDHLMIWWLDGFCYSKQTHWQYLLPPTRLLLEQSCNQGRQSGNLTNGVGNLAIWQACGIFFFGMLWGVDRRSNTKNAKSWHTLCASWCNNYNLDDQSSRYARDNLLKTAFKCT